MVTNKGSKAYFQEQWAPGIFVGCGLTISGCEMIWIFHCKHDLHTSSSQCLTPVSVA